MGNPELYVAYSTVGWRFNHNIMYFYLCEYVTMVVNE